MRRAQSLALAVPILLTLAVASAVAIGAPDSASQAKSIALFNGKDLTGWHTFIRHPKAKEAVDPRTDPKGVFKVEDGVIHVSGEEFGCLTTDDEYENYRLTVEFKWGAKKWPPRENVVRDSGILVHCVGPDKVWNKSIECQIQEHDCGDFWMVDGTTLVIDGKTETRFKKKKKDGERPTGEWNTVEVICDGDKVINIVNGVVVNEGTEASVTKGKILLQSEGAEVYYRNIKLTPLTK
ncbi:3-keto-disaccharide hydrolase [Singulisphaera acidiphila]|uniref:3-keto-alpha-glucoside-1,2-lyase/3-keto-2-hydroxy-glucal hydratase domain-containing protein n=1 Tax=Singulisphaera acidiphila (strain ATCC BAA-1392 / DSM 18658 / VKM B-2454 / MOB10) TaxID=886293 RepID=L0DME3_SINAD|nr:DUF1080 domain-containing protein [Singulisphaera acidiphila]AGA30554.1 protein of unknown function (DUF1080) [Singulisphaera acidiphila DSM 18658]